jgi:nitrite reductase/ring-hydroxylating ferredoxin subunit
LKKWGEEKLCEEKTLPIVFVCAKHASRFAMRAGKTRWPACFSQSINPCVYLINIWIYQRVRTST